MGEKARVTRQQGQRQGKEQQEREREQELSLGQAPAQGLAERPEASEASWAWAEEAAVTNVSRTEYGASQGREQAEADTASSD